MKFLRFWPELSARPTVEGEDLIMGWLSSLDKSAVLLVEMKAEGYSSEGIAKKLGVSSRTVRRRLNDLEESARCWFFSR